jgi:hypothetical protein
MTPRYTAGDPPVRPKTLFLGTAPNEVVVPVQFSEEEFAILDLYVEQCEALMRCAWVKEGHTVEFSLRCDENGDLSFASKVPPEDVVASLLHRLRPCMLQAEPASFLRVSSLVGGRIPNDQVRSYLRVLRRTYDGRNSQRLMRVEARGAGSEGLKPPGGLVLNSLEAVLDWLNAYEYHRDRAKREALELATGLLPLEATRVFFLGMLGDICGAVLSLGELAGILSGRDTGAPLTVSGIHGPGGDPE